MSFAHLVYAYLLGGVTLLPLLLVAFVYLHPKKVTEKVPELLRAGEIEESAQTGHDCFKQGWIFVTHEDLESQDEISAKTESVAESLEVKSAYSSLYKLVTNTTKGLNPSVNNGDHSGTTSFDNLAGGIGGGSTAGGHANTSPIPGAAPLPRPNAAAKKHRYYAVLKHGNLFLYKNERLQDVKHVIVLSNHVVSLWPRTLSEASLFTKYSSIAILRNDWARPRRLSDSFAGGDWTSDQKISIHDVLRPESGLPAPPGTIFVYTDLNIDKEDWYFALIRATKMETAVPRALNPAVYAKTMHLETEGMISLIQSLYSSEGQLQLKWFNAIIGRVFLSLQKTDVMKNYLTAKIERKLNKMKTPGFLDKFQITKVDAGKAAPTLTFPVLKEINPEGDLLVSFNFHYAGGMSMQLATKATINLGLRFKTREVDVLLSITLETISGPMLVRIKAPPSSRMWYTYEREPDVSIKIEPIISSRQMSYNIITNTIEKKFKDAIKDSLVFPHWDDLVFCHTPEELYRGGIWNKDDRPEETELVSPPAKETTDVDSEDISVETTLDVTAESEDQKAEVSSVTETIPTISQKAKVSKTISDLSRRLRKPKSAHTIGVDETHCLSDGSVIEPPKRLSASISSTENIQVALPTKQELLQGVSTFRKLGEWYSKSEKTSSKQNTVLSSTTGASYQPPEMITNRRSRKQSSATISSDIEKVPEGSLYDFGQELGENIRIPPPIDLMSPSSLKSQPPKLPPREFKATATAAPLSSLIPEDTDVSQPFGGFIHNEILAPQDPKYDGSSISEQVLPQDQFMEYPATPLTDASLSTSQGSTAVGRKPPPDLSHENDSTPSVSTAPL